MPKYVFITGGVVSSIGKGVVSASLGSMLEARGYKIAMMKMDPYLNVDPGTMNPYEHGEVFVTDDGAETDLDLGHYERFTNARLSQKSNITTGSVYNSVIQKERRGEYLGKTVQVIPHVTNEIKSMIRSLTTDSESDTDIVLVEIGGTVGDIEGLHFLEAIRQFKYDVPEHDCCYIHVTLVPYIEAAGELKTKPTQHSVRSLRDIGIQPNVIVCRTGSQSLGEDERKKIAMFCDVREEAIICGEDVSPLYAIPSNLQKQGLDTQVLKTLALEDGDCDMSKWDDVVARMAAATDEIRIAAIGKYVGHDDAYKSINEAFVHAGIVNDCKVNLEWVDSEQFESGNELEHVLGQYDGVLIGPGFGARGTEGKINAVQYARETKTPFMGICLGMQIAVIELARNKLGLKKASSTEFDADTPDPIISLLSEQRGITDLGGTMRLGAYSCKLTPGTRAYEAYGKDIIQERHRHRYEFNNEYLEPLTSYAGLVVSGTHSLGEHDLVEIIEIEDHPWFCAAQFHPEFKSTPLKPQPMFTGFVEAALEQKKSKG